MSTAASKLIHLADKPQQRLILENADIVTPNECIEGGTLVIEDGLISRIQQEPYRAKGERWNLDRQLLLPGFIDLHSDALEKYVEPRANSVFPLATAIMEFDKTLPACGITSMFHCIAYVYGDSRTRSLRTNDMADTIRQELHRLSPWLRTRTKAHIRYDILNSSARSRLEAHARNNLIHLLSFMDHTPGQGQYRDVEKYRKHMINDYKLPPEQVDANIARRFTAREIIEEEGLINLAKTCHDQGIPLASHDDDGEAKVQWAKQLHVSISEFPVCEEALEAANRADLWTMFGAPNVLRGKSQSGNMSAAEYMVDASGDILASDYAPMSLFHAMFKLVRTQGVALHEAVKWISLNPARAVGMDRFTGSLEEGKYADAVVVNPAGPVPHITTTFTAGSVTYAAVHPFSKRNYPLEDMVA